MNEITKIKQKVKENVMKTPDVKKKKKVNEFTKMLSPKAMKVHKQKEETYMKEYFERKKAKKMNKEE